MEQQPIGILAKCLIISTIANVLTVALLLVMTIKTAKVDIDNMVDARVIASTSSPIPVRIIGRPEVEVQGSVTVRTGLNESIDVRVRK